MNDVNARYLLNLLLKLLLCCDTVLNQADWIFIHLYSSFICHVFNFVTL